MKAKRANNPFSGGNMNLETNLSQALARTNTAVYMLNIKDQWSLNCSIYIELLIQVDEPEHYLKTC